MQKTLWQRALRDDAGSVAITFALLSITLFGVLALAVDMARTYNASSRLTSALDMAALAGTKALDRGASNAEIETEARASFNAYFNDSKMLGVETGAFRVDIDRNDATVTATVDASLATTFGAIIGRGRIDLSRVASVVYKVRNVELAMALDITGSMAEDNRIADLKTAAKDVIDVLLEDAPSESVTRIALIPWSASVNAGPYANLVSGGTSIDNCVLERQGSEAATDAYPGGAARLPAAPSSNYGPYTCSPVPITPLSGRSRRSDLKADIDTFVPYGRTAGHIGTAWGWYTISPSWAGIWPSASRPNPYNTQATLKNVLIMTDGLFNTSYVHGPLLPEEAMTNDSYAQFAALCTAMKQKRIVVYTVAFGVMEQRATDALRSCASSEAQAFMTITGAELQTAFRSIANQIKSMRLTK